MLIDEFSRGAEHLEDRAHLAARLARGDRLRIKWGVDPTAPDIHLGHTVPMRALRRWQDAGHLPVIIIGDWTARIGDPSGRSVTRPALDAATVADNATTYLDQLFGILARERTEVRFQSEWFDSMGLAEVLRLTASRTVQQLLQRSDFAERMRAERAIGVHELMYPLLQGYDSVAVDADVEIGGTDQLFNLLAARDVQRFYGRAEPQDVVTFPLLEGLDGVRKMSKSYGNYIGVAEPPAEQYGKAMSLPDELIVRYLTLVTDMPAEEVGDLAAGMGSGAVNPRDAKALLARSTVAQFHGEEAATRAEREFRRVVGAGGLPEASEIPRGRSAGGPAIEVVRALLACVGDSPSQSELRRLIAQGGVSFNDPDSGVRVAVASPTTAVDVVAGDEAGSRVDEQDGRLRVREGAVLRVGKRTFVSVEPA